MLSMIDRSLILVRPTELYIAWLKSVDPHYRESDDQEIREGEPTAYLVEECDKPLQGELDSVLKKHWQDIAKEEFSSWYDNPDDWPELKGVADFGKYFTVQPVEGVFDAVKTPIERE